MEPSKIDLLVHPGFGLIGARELTVRHRKLFERYKQRAAQTAADENRFLIAVLFLDEGLRPAYLEGKTNPTTTATYDALTEIERIVGERYLAQSGSTFLHETSNKLEEARPFYDQLRTNLDGRNISISPTADVRAFGETILKCVPAVAANFHKFFGMQNPVTLDLHDTNFGVRPRESRRNEARRLQDALPDLQERFRAQYGNVLRFNPSVPGIDLGG